MLMVNILQNDLTTEEISILSKLVISSRHIFPSRNRSSVSILSPLFNELFNILSATSVVAGMILQGDF